MSSMPDRLAALERRIATLEANPATSLRFGSVTGVEGGFARVQLPDGQNMVSALIPTVQSRVLKDQDIKMPDIGEPVACLFAGQGLETGIVVGGITLWPHTEISRRLIQYHRKKCFFLSI